MANGNGGGTNTRAWVAILVSVAIGSGTITYGITNAVLNKAQGMLIDRIAKIETQGSEAFRVAQERTDGKLVLMNDKMDRAIALIEKHVAGTPR